MLGIIFFLSQTDFKLIIEAIVDGWYRLTEPSVDREIRADLTEKAEEKARILAEKQAEIDKWTQALKDNEAFVEIQKHLGDYTKDELAKECKCIYADAFPPVTFEAKPKDEMVRISVADNNEKVIGPYGNLFEMYGRK